MCMQMMIETSWREALAEEFEKPYFKDLTAFVSEAYRTSTVYPAEEKIFAAFHRTPFDRVKVVILGQDPYHEPGQAQGLAFYVPPDIRTPPSLVNIIKEVASDMRDTTRHCEERSDVAIHPDLLSWAEQGVLLLNATLTVEAHRAGSHQGKGWETFTDAVIRTLATQREHLVFILWGSYAQKKGAFIDPARHAILTSAHPSPLSAYRGFFGSKPFSKANTYLTTHGLTPIHWA